MKKIVPAVETIICDVCGTERAWFGYGTRVVINTNRRTGLMGDVEPLEKRLDLCDECASRIDDVLKLKW